MKYFETDVLSSRERQNYESKGLFCYDLRDSDDGSEIATIEKSVFVNKIGSMITDKEIKFDKTNDIDFVDYENFCSNNKRVYSVRDLVPQKKVLNISFVGLDNWDRPVYKDKSGNLYKDISLGRGVHDLEEYLYTSCNNEFDGEPYYNIDCDLKVKVTNKDRNREDR